MSKQQRQAKHTKKVRTVETADQRVARILREDKARRVQVGVGIVVVGGTVIGALGMALTHRIPWPVAVGLTLLALFRGYALQREMRRESEPETPADPKAKPDRQARRFAIGR